MLGSRLQTYKYDEGLSYYFSRRQAVSVRDRFHTQGSTARRMVSSVRSSLDLLVFLERVPLPDLAALGARDPVVT